MVIFKKDRSFKMETEINPLIQIAAFIISVYVGKVLLP